MHYMYIMLLLIGQPICYSERAVAKNTIGGTNQSILAEPVKHDHGLEYYSIPQNENQLPADEVSHQINQRRAHHNSDKHAKHIKETSKLEKVNDNFSKGLFLVKSHTALQNTDSDIAHHPDKVIVKLAHEGGDQSILVKILKHNPISVYASTPRDNNILPVVQVLPQVNAYIINQDRDMNADTTEENSRQANAKNNITTAVSQINPHISLTNIGSEAKGKEGEANSNPENATDEITKVQKEVLPQVYMVLLDNYGHFRDTKEGNFIQEKAQNNIIKQSQNIQPINRYYMVTNYNNKIFQDKSNPLFDVEKTKHEDNTRVVRDAGDDKGESLGFTGDLLSPHPTTVNMNSIRTTTQESYKTSPSEEHISQQTSTILPNQSSTYDPPPVPYCHQSCLKALNATHLYSNGSLILSQESDLTLICELPLNMKFYLVNLIWLFQPDNSPDGQCSLTTQEFISSCHGFHTIKNTDDRNSTILRETITLSNILVNHTGRYMCQVQMTCCPDSQEHTMSQERTFHITIRVWTANYTYDLAMAGSAAICLLLIVVGVSFCLRQQRDDDHITIEEQRKEIKPPTVLHMPLIDDQDNDSFDSNFDEQD